MKPQSAPERAVKTITQFHRETAGELVVSREKFTGIIASIMKLYAGEDEYLVLCRSDMNGVETAEMPEKSKNNICYEKDLSRWKTLLDENKFLSFNRHDGKCVKKEFRSWMLIPVSIKKELFLAVIIARRKGSFSDSEKESAQQMGTFFTSVLKDIRSRNKKAAAIADEARHRLLLRTQTALERRQGEFPGFFQADDYSAGIGSDMGQAYKNGEDIFLACICDITADDINRQIGLVYLDTWFSILSQTSLDVPNMIGRLNNDMVKRTAECYASLAAARYSRKTEQLELTGTGSAHAFFFSHNDMEIKSFSFGPAAGINKDIKAITQVFFVKSGDILCLCTDGLTETRKGNGELFGAEAVGELIRRNYFLSAKDLADKILKTVTETGAAKINQDDRTLQILKFE